MFYERVPEIVQPEEIKYEAIKAITALDNCISYMGHK